MKLFGNGKAQGVALSGMKPKWLGNNTVRSEPNVLGRMDAGEPSFGPRDRMWRGLAEWCECHGLRAPPAASLHLATPAGQADAHRVSSSSSTSPSPN